MFYENAWIEQITGHAACHLSIGIFHTSICCAVYTSVSNFACILCLKSAIDFHWWIMCVQSMLGYFYSHWDKSTDQQNFKSVQLIASSHSARAEALRNFNFNFKDTKSALEETATFYDVTMWIICTVKLFQSVPIHTVHEVRSDKKFLWMLFRLILIYSENGLFNLFVLLELDTRSPDWLVNKDTFFIFGQGCIGKDLIFSN